MRCVALRYGPYGNFRQTDNKITLVCCLSFCQLDYSSFFAKLWLVYLIGSGNFIEILCRNFTDAQAQRYPPSLDHTLDDSLLWVTSQVRHRSLRSFFFLVANS